MVETFFKTLKAELVWRQPWYTRRRCQLALFQYINGFYNPWRRHSALGYKRPVTFDLKAASVRAPRPERKRDMSSAKNQNGPTRMADANALHFEHLAPLSQAIT